VTKSNTSDFKFLPAFMSAAEVPLCSICGEHPCVPKLRGTGMSKGCQECRRKANTRAKKAREAKKQGQLEHHTADVERRLQAEIEENHKEVLLRLQALEAKLNQILRKL
jgi:hypothetical protein